MTIVQEHFDDLDLSESVIQNEEWHGRSLWLYAVGVAANPGHPLFYKRLLRTELPVVLVFWNVEGVRREVFEYEVSRTTNRFKPLRVEEVGSVEGIDSMSEYRFEGVALHPEAYVTWHICAGRFELRLGPVDEIR